MIRELDPRPIYCTYVLFDFCGIPRYVGKGKIGRENAHERKISIHSINWRMADFIERTWMVLDEIPKCYVRKNVSEGDAFASEIALIKAIGRADKGLGPLANLTDGGEGLAGFNPSLRTRRLIAENSRAQILGLSIEERRAFALNASLHVERIIWINDGQHNKRLKRNDLLLDGWVYGRLYKSHVNFTRSINGTIWINDGHKSKRINPTEMIPKGWELGRKHKEQLQRFCACGCGLSPLRNSTWVRGHALRRTEHQEAARVGRRKLTTVIDPNGLSDVDTTIESPTTTSGP